MDERCLIDVRGLYELLLDHMGPTHWWPADTRFEIAIGAILTQNTAWGNVETALDRMKAADVLNARSIADLPDETLWDLIRSTGYYRQKAVYLRAFCQWFLDLGEWSHDDDIPALVRCSTGPRSSPTATPVACSKPSAWTTCRNPMRGSVAASCRRSTPTPGAFRNSRSSTV